MAKLNNKQLQQLAEFMANLGLVFFASVITPLFTKVDNVNPYNIVLGLGAALVCLFISLSLLTKKP